MILPSPFATATSCTSTPSLVSRMRPHRLTCGPIPARSHTRRRGAPAPTSGSWRCSRHNRIRQGKARARAHPAAREPATAARIRSSGSIPWSIIRIISARMSRVAKIVASGAAALAAPSPSALWLAGVDVSTASPYHQGAVIFLDTAPAATRSRSSAPKAPRPRSESSAHQRTELQLPSEPFSSSLRDRERGFSGQIMPENIVVGAQAQAVASSSPTMPGATRRRRRRCRRRRPRSSRRRFSTSG